MSLSILIYTLDFGNKLRPTDKTHIETDDRVEIRNICAQRTLYGYGYNNDDAGIIIFLLLPTPQLLPTLILICKFMLFVIGLRTYINYINLN